MVVVVVVMMMMMIGDDEGRKLEIENCVIIRRFMLDMKRSNCENQLLSYSL